MDVEDPASPRLPAEAAQPCLVATAEQQFGPLGAAVAAEDTAAYSLLVPAVLRPLFVDLTDC